MTAVNDNTPEFDDGDGDGSTATAAASTAEGSTAVGTYAGTDSDAADTLTYTIRTAAQAGTSVDHDLFSIVSGTGVLTFTSAPNFEAPGCGAGNNANTCVVVLMVSDGTNSATITVTVTITNVAIDIVANSARLAERAAADDAV